MKTKVQHSALELVHEPLGYVRILAMTLPRAVREDKNHRRDTNACQDSGLSYTTTPTHHLYDLSIVPDGTTQNHAEDHSYDLQ